MAHQNECPRFWHTRQDTACCVLVMRKACVMLLLEGDLLFEVFFHHNSLDIQNFMFFRITRFLDRTSSQNGSPAGDFGLRGKTPRATRLRLCLCLAKRASYHSFSFLRGSAVFRGLRPRVGTAPVTRRMCCRPMPIRAGSNNGPFSKPYFIVGVESDKYFKNAPLGLGILSHDWSKHT